MSGSNGHSAGGTAEIVLKSGRYSLELRSDFFIEGGSNDLYLSNDPASVAGGRRLGALQSQSGAQSYDLADSGAAYAWVVIWCRPFNIGIGRGRLD